MSTQLSMENAKKYHYVPFKVERELWARYKLIEDNTILKIKNVLVNVKMDTSLDEVLKKRQEKKGKVKVPINIQVQMHNVVGVEVPQDLRGLPDTEKYSPSELVESVVEEDLEFERLDPTTWVSIYELKNKIKLKVQNTLIDVARTNKYDDTGDPIYTVSSAADIKIIIPEKYRRTREIRSRVKRI